MPRGKAIGLSLYEEVFLEVRADMPRRELHALFCGHFGRDDVTLDALKGLMKRNGWGTGRTGRFVKGQAPQNKGKAMPPETRAKASRSWFQKGNRPHTTRHLGHERVSKEGYVEVSVAETNPYTGFERRYVLKHRHLWERANGPVPEGHALKCLDGNRRNTDPSNWEPVPRALLPRLAGWAGRGRPVLAYDAAAPEVRPALLAIAKVEHKARTARGKR